MTTPNPSFNHANADASAALPNRRPSGAVSMGGYSRRGGDDLTTAIYSLAGPLVLTLLASVIQTASAFNICYKLTPGLCKSMDNYNMALGMVSAIAICIYLAVFAVARASLPEKSMMYLSLFLFLWWVAGVGATTFNTMLVYPTGYFATWSALIFSAFIMQAEWEQFRSMVSTVKELETHGRATFYLFLSSIVVLISAIFECGNAPCNGNDIFALLASSASIVICFVLLRVDGERMRGIDKAMAFFLCGFWTITMGVLTILGPFLMWGNGFFATWGAFLSSFFVAQAKLFPQTLGQGERGI